MSDHDLSVSSRYSRHPYWNVLLEAEFLHNLARPNTERSSEVDSEPTPSPLLQTPGWALTILPEIEKNLTSQSQSVTKRLNRRLTKNKRKLKKQRELKGKIFNKSGDWDDLLLVQKMLGKEDPRKNHCDDSGSDSDDDVIFDTIDSEEIMLEIAPEPKLKKNERKPSKLTEEIRQRVSQAKFKERAKLDGLEKLRTLKKPFRGLIRSKVDKHLNCPPNNFSFLVYSGRGLQDLRRSG